MSDNFVKLASLHQLSISKLMRSRSFEDDIGADFDVNVAATLASEHGINALKGKAGTTYDALVYAGAIALWHLKKHDSLEDAAAQIRKALDDGKALEHFNAARV